MTTATATAETTVLLTSVGRRYDIVAAFAQHARVVAVDPNPLAPARYAAQICHSAPLIDSPDYIPVLQELCARYSVSAVLPLSDLDGEVLAQARADGKLPAFVPDPQVATAIYDKYRTHQLLTAYGLPSAPTVLPGRPWNATR